MSRRPRLLLLASRVPYPPIGGDRLKNLNLIRRLSKHFDMDLALMAEQPPSAEALATLQGHARSVEIFPVAPWRCRLNTLRAVFTGDALQVAYYRFKGFQEIVRRKAAEADVVLATTPRTALYGLDLAGPKVLDLADSQVTNTGNGVRSSSSALWKLIYWLESRRIGAFELACINAYDRTLFFNFEECESFALPRRTRWIPHGVNGELFEYPHPKERRRAVAFLGKMDYRPNVEAVKWFCAHALQHLPSDVRFYIIGAVPTTEVRALAQHHPQVEVTGFLEDPYALIASCGAVVAPMQSGSGIQNKVLEAMALGMPVVGTDLALRPIRGARHEEHFLVADAPEPMVAAILELLDHPSVAERMGTAARDFVRQHFSWECWEAVMLETLSEAMRAHGQSAPVLPVGLPEGAGSDQ